MTSIVIGKTPAQIAAMTSKAISQLGATDINALTTQQTAALTAPQLNALSTSALDAFTAPQISAVTAIYSNNAAKGASYADINGGGGYSLTQITGQSVTYATPSGDSAAQLVSLASNIASALKSGGEAMLSSSNTYGNLVGDHMFEVAGINAATETVTLQNPWNTAYGSGSVAMTFTETLSQLASDGVWFYISQRGAGMAQASNAYSAA
jgi:hypothetical protein